MPNKKTDLVPGHNSQITPAKEISLNGAKFAGETEVVNYTNRSVRGIDDQSVIEAIASGDPNFKIRVQAIFKIQTTEQLLKLRSNESDPTVLDYIDRRIKELTNPNIRYQEIRDEYRQRRREPDYVKGMYQEYGLDLTDEELSRKLIRPDHRKDEQLNKNVIDPQYREDTYREHGMDMADQDELKVRRGDPQYRRNGMDLINEALSARSELVESKLNQSFVKRLLRLLKLSG